MSIDKPLEKEVIPDKIVNATDLKSPIPLLRLKKELAVMKSMEIIRIDCTDSGSGDDIANWCQRMDHSFLGGKNEGEVYSFFIAK